MIIYGDSVGYMSYMELWLILFWNYWLVVDLPLWKMMEFVSWDDEIPNICKNKIHVPIHQPDIVYHSVIY